MRHLRTYRKGSSFLAALALSTVLLATPGVAQQNPYPIRSKPQPTLSKAGTPLPRPPVPNRNVSLPPGARYGSFYYYGYGRYLHPASAPGYEYETHNGERNTPKFDELKSYESQPGEITKPTFKNY